MVFAEVITGIALVKQATDFIKSNINTVNDIKGIAAEIDKLFEGQAQINKQRGKGLSVADQFGINQVAKETIDAKLAEEKIREVATLVDFRFGHGTWQSIIDERARRIREAREAERLARIAKQKKRDEIVEAATIVGAVIFMCAVFVGFIWLIVRA